MPPGILPGSICLPARSRFQTEILHNAIPYFAELYGGLGGLNVQNEIVDLLARGNLAHSNGDLVSARDAFERAQVASKQIGNPSLEMHALNGLGIILLAEGHFEKAHEVFSHAAYLAEESDSKSTSHKSSPQKVPKHTDTDPFWLSSVELIEFSLYHARTLLQNGFITASLDWCNRANTLCGTLRSQSEILRAENELSLTLQKVDRLINEVMSILIELHRRK
jgi:tetratricopeptide (TPR) repeat protein